jgi:hypothetical protein
MDRDCDEMTLFAIDVPRMFAAAVARKCVEPRMLRAVLAVRPLIWLVRVITILSDR